MEVVVSLIPARGGSERIPRKNIRLLKGKPLMQYAMEASLNSDVDETWVSTEDEEIKQFALDFGVKVLDRPKELATATASMNDVVLHFAKNIDFDIVVLILPVYPLVTVNDINGSLDNLFKSEYDSLLTVTRKKYFRWGDKQGWFDSLDYDINNRPRSQDYKGFLIEDGGIYITSKRDLLNSGCFLNGYVGGYVLDHPSIDIDTELDIKIAEVLLDEA